jgi:hypothetical protein
MTFQTYTDEEQLWLDVNTKVSDGIHFSPDQFSEYDYAIRCWAHDSQQRDQQKTTEGDLEFFKHRELRTSFNELTKSVASFYSTQFEEIAHAFVHKAQVTENIEKSVRSARDLVSQSRERFSMNPKMLLEIWRKCIKYQKELSIIGEIEALVQTPTAVFRLLDQDETLEAVGLLKKSQEAWNDAQMSNITALADVRKRVELCQERVIENISNGLMNQLFVQAAPDFLDFFPHAKESDAREESADVDTRLTTQYCQALVTLERQGQFSTVLRDNFTAKIIETMTGTADTIKLKRHRAGGEAKDSSHEFVQAYESFTAQNPIVAFLNAILCKIWVLLARCKAIDDHIGEGSITFGMAWGKVTEELRLLIQVFTVATGTKVAGPTTLSYTFLPAETTNSTATYNVIRLQLDVRPSRFNILLALPLLLKFREQVVARFRLAGEYADQLCAAEYQDKARRLVMERAQALSVVQINHRPIKSELHDVPVFFITPTFVENLTHFVRAAEKFATIRPVLAKAAADLIQAFTKGCAAQLTGFDPSQSFYASQLLSRRRDEDAPRRRDEDGPVPPKVLLNFQVQPLLQRAVFDGCESDIDDFIGPFFEFEENSEADVFNGNKVLKVEETVRERFQIPTIATIVESLFFVRKQVSAILAASPFGDHSRLIEEERKRLDIVIVHCIMFLHVEMRCRCYAEIVPVLLNGDFRLATPPSSADNYATILCSLYQSTMERLSTALIPARLQFVFLGIPRLVYKLHLKFLPKVKEINDKGAQGILLNLALFRQTFSSFRYPENQLYSKAHWFASNIFLSGDRIVMALKSIKKSFTLEEIEPIFQMPQKAADNSLESVRILFRQGD